MKARLTVLVVVLFALMTPIGASAQQLPPGDSRNAAFRVYFHEIVTFNQASISDFQKMAVGTSYKLPNGGHDVLEAGDTKGIWGKEFKKRYGYPYPDNSTFNHPPENTTTVATTPTAANTKLDSIRNFFERGVILLGVLTALLVLTALGWLLTRKLANPVTSGPPMREGGITDSSAPEYFRSMASERTANTTDFVAAERIRVVNIRRGRGYGLMRVRYRGRLTTEVKRLNGETVYQATVEYPGGRQEMLYCLQGCANDLTYMGTRYFADRLFRFEPENASVYVPPQETVVAAGNAEIRINEDELSVVHGGRSVTFGASNWGVRKGPDGGLIISDEGRTDIEFRDGRIYGAAIEKPASQPTTDQSAAAFES